MLPSQLAAESFQAYPPKGRALATANLALLQDLPLGIVPFLLGEIIQYDWKFPYEQRELTNQLDYLTKLWPEKRKREVERFSALQLGDALQNSDWVNQPARFLEQLSAHLWSTNQMDGFRGASESYVRRFHSTLAAEQVPVPRLGIAVFGEGVSTTSYKLFRKLRRAGVYFSHVEPAGGMAKITAMLQTRAAAHWDDYAHWYVQGTAPDAAIPGFTCLSYDGLAAARTKLSALMMAAYEAPKFDPEQLRTTLASTTPEQVGLPESGDGVLDRFQLSLLTEGSGTQIYSTTFVQWAAREALRRAHPTTIVTRYTPRQKERSMNELLTGGAAKPAADPEGSLIDGDMAAYYTWINMQRLPGADTLRFLSWFEGHGEAFVIAPGLKAGTEDPSPIDMGGILAKLT